MNFYIFIIQNLTIVIILYFKVSNPLTQIKLTYKIFQPVSLVILPNFTAMEFEAYQKHKIGALERDVVNL